MTQNATNKGRRRTAMHKFYFVKPRSDSNADELAQKLIHLKPVEEVWLTDGDYGFVVKTKFFDGKEPNDVTNYLSKHVDERFGKVVSYCTYSK